MLKQPLSHNSDFRAPPAESLFWNIMPHRVNKTLTPPKVNNKFIDPHFEWVFMAYLTLLSPRSGQGSKTRGGAKHHPLEINKSYFGTYKSYDHMQKIRPISQNFNEILTFENWEQMRFCHTLTYENRRNSLNFWDRGLKFWI